MPWHHDLMNVRTIIAIASIVATFHASSATLTGKVVKVADGDTITILAGTEQHRVRLQAPFRPATTSSAGKNGRAQNTAGVSNEQFVVEPASQTLM
jgi:endonuclease YncB( thermonuclease family)